MKHCGLYKLEWSFWISLRFSLCRALFPVPDATEKKADGRATVRHTGHSGGLWWDGADLITSIRDGGVMTLTFGG